MSTLITITTGTTGGQRKEKKETSWFEEKKEFLQKEYGVDITPLRKYNALIDEVIKRGESHRRSLWEVFHRLQLLGARPEELMKGYMKYGRRWFDILWKRIGGPTGDKQGDCYIVRLAVPPHLNMLTKRMKGSTIPYLEIVSSTPLEREVAIRDRGSWTTVIMRLPYPIDRRRIFQRIEKVGAEQSWYEVLTREEIKEIIRILATGEVVVLSPYIVHEVSARCWCLNPQWIVEMTHLLRKENRCWPNTDTVVGMIALSEEPPQGRGRPRCRQKGRAFHRDYGVCVPNPLLHTITVDRGKVVDRIQRRRKLLKELVKDVNERYDPDGQRNKRGEWELSGVDARQVLVFRVMSGRCIYMDRSRRIVEFGPSGGEYDWTQGRLDVSYLRIVGASALGLNRIWGWAVFKNIQGGLLVLPDEHWDAIVWMWKKDMLVWPQFVEAKGIPTRTLPAWNGGEGRACRGRLEREGGGERYPSHLGEMNVRFQTRETVLLQEATASDEAGVPGKMEVYVPRVSFRIRMKKVRKMLQECKETTSEYIVPLLVKAMGLRMGYLCNLGVGGMIVWRKIWMASHSKTWWWERDNHIPVMRVPPRNGYPTINKIKEELSRRGLWDVSFPVGYATEVSKEGTGISASRCLTFYEVWKIAYQGEFAVDGGGILLNLREATDTQKDGSELRDYPGMGEVIPQDEPPKARFVGRTPPLTKEQGEIWRQDRRIREKDNMIPTYPTCGYEDCTTPDHNPDSAYINYGVSKGSGLRGVPGGREVE